MRTELKQLSVGVVLLLVLGIAGFLYRGVLERPAPLTDGQGVACTADAKVCPDGTGVGRQGPNCEFAACPLPNVEIKDAQLAFALPAGYGVGVQEPGADGAEEGMLAFYKKPSKSASIDHFITVYRYPIPEGKTADSVLIAHTRFQPADMPAEDLSKFKTVTIGGRTFKTVVIERFEGQVESAYYLVRATDVIRFELVERDVTEWMNPSLVVSDLPEHKALAALLATIQSK